MLILDIRGCGYLFSVSADADVKNNVDIQSTSSDRPPSALNTPPARLWQKLLFTLFQSGCD